MLRFQGLTFDRHICCICFEPKESLEQWWMDEAGTRWDICVDCKADEADYLVGTTRHHQAALNAC